MSLSFKHSHEKSSEVSVQNALEHFIKSGPSQNNNQPELSKTEEEFMEKAFQYAQEALSNQEVPVGCIFVYKQEIIAVGRNTVNETKNATRHAELNCIDQVNDYCQCNNLAVTEIFKNISVYVTVEPCIMCIAALFDLKTKAIYFGCKNDRFGGQTVFDVAKVLKPQTLMAGGYRADEAMELLKEFYKGVNPNAPPSKVKARGKKEGTKNATAEDS